MWNQVKTVFLLGLMSGIVLAVGYFFKGYYGLIVACVLAVVMILLFGGDNSM